MNNNEIRNKIIFKLSDNELDIFISELFKLRQNLTNNVPLGLTECDMLLQVSSLEKERRLNSKYTNFSSKISKNAFAIAIITLVFAIGAFVFSCSDYKSDKGWQNLQREQNTTIVEQNNEIIKILQTIQKN